MPRKPDDIALPLKNSAFVYTLMENSQTAKVAGISFAAGVAVGWFLHSFVLKVRTTSRTATKSCSCV